MTSSIDKPFSQACENNKDPIQQTLHAYLTGTGVLLEIGSGTGQHGAYISQYYPSIMWQPSDRSENIAGIQAWVNETQRDNFLNPLLLDVNDAEWNNEKVNFIYSANTAHIMSWEEVKKLFAFLPQCLCHEGYFFLYGPFNYNNQYTSESNARFDQWLKSQAAHRAIRDFEAINQLALEHDLTLINDHSMPANNRLLVWRYTS